MATAWSSARRNHETSRPGSASRRVPSNDSFNSSGISALSPTNFWYAE